MKTEHKVNVKETIVSIVSDLLYKKVNEEDDGDSTLALLGADSLDIIEIEIEIEKRLGFQDGKFFEEELNVNMTLNELIKKAIRSFGKEINS